MPRKSNPIDTVSSAAYMRAFKVGLDDLRRKAAKAQKLRWVAPQKYRGQAVEHAFLVCERGVLRRILDRHDGTEKYAFSKWRRSDPEESHAAVWDPDDPPRRWKKIQWPDVVDIYES